MATKKIFTLACSTAMLSFGFSIGQAQDSAVARNDEPVEIRTKEKTRNIERERAITLREDAAPVADKTENAFTAFDISDRSTDNNKVGPNGEEVFMKRSKYYYLDEKGHKVKIKSIHLKDKPKHS